MTAIVHLILPTLLNFKLDLFKKKKKGTLTSIFHNFAFRTFSLKDLFFTDSQVITRG